MKQNLMTTPAVLVPLAAARRHLETARSLDEVAGVHGEAANKTTGSVSPARVEEVSVLRREVTALADAVLLLAKALAKANEIGVVGGRPTVAKNADEIAAELLRRLEGPTPGGKAAAPAPPVEQVPPLIRGRRQFDDGGAYLGGWPRRAPDSDPKEGLRVSPSFQPLEPVNLAEAEREAKRAAERAAEAAEHLQAARDAVQRADGPDAAA